jgi:hypothetical protein
LVRAHPYFFAISESGNIFLNKEPAWSLTAIGTFVPNIALSSLALWSWHGNIMPIANIANKTFPFSTGYLNEERFRASNNRKSVTSRLLTVTP